jgi:invasion protein IalB
MVVDFPDDALPLYKALPSLSRSEMSVFRLSLLVALVLTAFEPCVFAQTSQSTTATYNDWVVRCEKGDQGNVCEMTQTTQLKDTSQLVSLIAVGAPKADGSAKVVFQLPVNVWLQAGVTLASSDGQTAIVSNFTRCLPAGCFAETDINQTVLKKLRAMKDQGSLRFKDGNQKDVTIPVSFKGFTQANDAMAKEGAAGR